jgi:hypothetical protein
MPVVTEQEKSDENMDKSGLYDDKRNVFAHEEEHLNSEMNGYKFILGFNRSPSESQRKTTASRERYSMGEGTTWKQMTIPFAAELQ